MSPATGRGGLLAVLEQAAAALRAAAGMPLADTVPDRELTQVVQRLEALARMCTGQKLAAVAEITRRHAHHGESAASTQDLLVRTLNMSRGEARTQADLAEALQAVPHTAEALKHGLVGVGQAAETVKKAQELTTAAANTDDPGTAAATTELVAELDRYAAEQGQTMDRGRLGRQIDQFVHQRGVDVLADRERRAWQRRGLWFGQRDGLPTLEARLPVEGMAAVRAALDALGKPDGAADPRTPAQRHADALVTLATKYLDEGSLPDVAAQRPHVLLITTPDALHGTEGAEPSLLNGTEAISNDLARQICCDARLTVVVQDDDGKILDAHPQRRDPTPRQRDAVIARDKTCIGCGAPPTRCQIHHIHWRSHKGPTLVENLALVCWSCHHHIHHQQWQVTRTPDGRYHTGPPGQVQGQILRHTG